MSRDVQFSPDTGLQILGNTSSTVQYSVVGDTTNMEYSVVGPKTVSSQVSQMIVVIICIVACYNLVLASLSHNNYTWTFSTSQVDLTHNDDYVVIIVNIINFTSSMQ